MLEERMGDFMLEERMAALQFSRVIKFPFAMTSPFMTLVIIGVQLGVSNRPGYCL